MTNNWSCLPRAFAQALKVPVDDLIRTIGHDGSEIIWPTLVGPARHRGFHIQECIDVAARLGFSVTPFEMFPQHAPAFTVPAYTVVFGGSEEAAIQRFAEIVRTTRGVLTGYGNVVGHAEPYAFGRVGDYAFAECARHCFTPLCAWRIT